MDSTIRCFDIRPFVIEQRCIKIYQGHKFSQEKLLIKAAWNFDDSIISSGSADRF